MFSTEICQEYIQTFVFYKFSLNSYLGIKDNVEHLMVEDKFYKFLNMEIMDSKIVFEFEKKNVLVVERIENLLIFTLYKNSILYDITTPIIQYKPLSNKKTIFDIIELM